MTRYIIRRLLQAIPLLFIISVILFVLMRTTGDPLATLGGRRVPRPEDRERLTRQLGLDKPLYSSMCTGWSATTGPGSTWTAMAWPRRPARKRACCAASSAPRWSAGASQAWDIIWERMPNTLLLMIPAEIIVILFSLVIGIYSALRQYS